MQNAVAALLFDFIKSALYYPQSAVLDMTAIPPDWRQLAQALVFLADCMREQAEFGAALSRGDLHHELPSVENVLAAPLKAIHGMFMHLTWQTQEVAKGDYRQRVDYMGEFSQAFNTMVEQLETRREALLKEQNIITQRNTELEQTQNLLLSLVLDDVRWLEILDAENGELIFQNQSASTAFSSMPELERIMLERLISGPCSAANTPVTWECAINVGRSTASYTQYFSIISHAVPWKGRNAIAHMVTDVTKSRQNELELEHMAFSDSLTGAYNRRYGMNFMEELCADKKNFVVAFIDIDYLKYCNDEFGHEEGDSYILAVSESLKLLDGQPLVCRVGGDEFMLVQCGQPAERLEKSLSALRERLIAESGKYRRSFSYGICSYDGAVPVSEVMSMADRKMYEFKFQHKAQRMG